MQQNAGAKSVLRALHGIEGGWRGGDSCQSQERQSDPMTTKPRIDLRPGVTQPAVLLISRRQVAECDVASVVTGLKPLLATREDTWLYRSQMSLTVDGYNQDARALVDIPEVRTFLRAFEREWP